MNQQAQQIITKLQLQPLHMEGGYFRRTHTVRDYSREGQTIRETSVIYFLLNPDTYSKIHRLPTSEIYHFYLGDPVELLLLENNGDAKVIQFGNQVLNNEQPQVVVPKSCWQGSRLKSGGQFALIGTTMTPAFEDTDFERPESITLLLEKYPEEVHPLIKALYE
jgi:uncharacterized protein